MAKRSKIDKVMRLTQCGWRAYEGQATAAVYDNLDCEKDRRSRARWLAKGEELHCIGCERECQLPHPDGFQRPLFKYPAPPKPIFRLHPDQLLSTRKVLKVMEAAYVLNISPSQVRAMIHEGRFSVLPDPPLRIPVEEIKASFAEADYWTSPIDSLLDEKARQMAVNSK